LSAAPTSKTRPKLFFAADSQHAGIGGDVKRRRSQEQVGRLVNRRHWTIAVSCRRTGDDHGAVGKRHERFTTDTMAVAATLLGERRPDHGARLSIRQAPADRTASTLSTSKAKSST
jgi:hypothetical protein